MRPRLAAKGLAVMLCLSLLPNLSPLDAHGRSLADLSQTHRTPEALAELTGPARLEQEADPLSTGVEYFAVETRKLDDGRLVDRVTINGPPTPPAGIERHAVDAVALAARTSAAVLSEMPAYDWSYGCSATSAAMIAAYYDRTAYPEMYTGPTNDGVMPMDNSIWGHTTWSTCDGSPDVSVGECPLSVTHNGIDGRSTRGHVDDYWTGYACEGPDPYEVNGWSEHEPAASAGDFMKTNKWFASQGFNVDGSTTFYFDRSGARLPTSVLMSNPEGAYDGGVGIELFYESRGYTVTTAYNQYIRGRGSDPNLGFTYDEYRAEIDAGRPVMVHLTGHTMVGVGYDDVGGEAMFIHDTWDYSTHTMTWGASYQEMEHLGVTIVQLEEPSVAAPTVTSITPDSGCYTETVQITDLAGSHFQSGADVILTKSGQSDIGASDVTVVSTSSITCHIDLTDATTGLWDVVVTNPDLRSGTLRDGFEVRSGDVHSLHLPLLLRGYPPSGPETGFWEGSNMEFYVTQDGSYVDDFAIHVSVTDCGDYKITHTPQERVRNDEFSFSGGLYASGAFGSVVSAKGTTGLDSFYIPNCGRVSGGPWAWSASWKSSLQPSAMSAELETAVGLGAEAVSSEAYKVTVVEPTP